MGLLSLHLLDDKFFNTFKKSSGLHHRAPNPGTGVKSFLYYPVLKAGRDIGNILVLQLTILNAICLVGGHHYNLVLLV